MGLLPLEFTDCLTDSPYFRENLHAHEKELEKTSQQIKGLIKEVKDLLSAARTLSRAQRTLSNSLQNFKFECIGTTQTDDEIVISGSLREFGKLIACIEDERDRMLERAYDQIILPLEGFRKENIGGVKDGKKKFEKQTAKFCQSQERYLSLSTKKQDTVLQEFLKYGKSTRTDGKAQQFHKADATLEMEQRHFYQASLEYVFLLQEVQERKKFEFVETLLGFMYGWLTFYHQGHEVANDFKPFMSDLQFRIQKTRENFNATRDKTESLMRKMLEVRKMKPVEPQGFSSSMYTRQGYLFLMEKKTLGTTWIKHYCMYRKDNKEFVMIPYNQMTGKFSTNNETVKLESCTRRMSDSIEKRFCFDITAADRPGVTYTLQALSEEDRKLWMDVMDGKEPNYASPGKVPKSEERVLDEVGFNFVTKCISVLESRGLEDHGLYRVVGVSSKVSKLLQMGLDRRKVEKLNLDNTYEWETKTVTSALKIYLRNLPEPLMTFRFHNSFIAAAKQESVALRVNDVHTLVHRLPEQNLRMLDILIQHLRRVADKADKNLMNVSNLGVCFGPTLLRPEEETVAAIMDIKFCNVVVEILIDNFEKIFKSNPEICDVPQRESHIQRTQVTPPPVTANNQINHAPYSRSSPQSTPPPPSQVHAIRGVGAKFHGSQPVTHVSAVIKSYYDGPLSVNMSSSMYNVHQAVPVRDAAFLRDHGNSSSGLHQANIRAAGVTAYSEGNLHTMSQGSHAHSPRQQHPKQKTAFHYNPIMNSEKNESLSLAQNSTSSSNESVSSLSSRDLSNHNNYTTASPQKTLRGNKLAMHYATSYRPPESMRVRTLYACVGENDGELSFEPNQIITNVRRSLEPGWLEGTLNGRTGLVPENYVEFLP